MQKVANKTRRPSANILLYPTNPTVSSISKGVFTINVSNIIYAGTQPDHFGHTRVGIPGYLILYSSTLLLGNTINNTIPSIYRME